ncbi:LPXTG cell wall anchor domain-containing protein [Paenibacillus odorifer]
MLFCGESSNIWIAILGLMLLGFVLFYLIKKYIKQRK